MIVVAIEHPDRSNPVVDLANELGTHTGMEVRSVHVDTTLDAGSGSDSDDSDTAVEAGDAGNHETDEIEVVADAIVEAARSDRLLVLATNHASRWSGKYSVAEHVIDRRTGPTVLVGPRYQAQDRSGPIVVAADSSVDAERMAVHAMAMATAYSVGLQLTRVISRSEAADEQTRTEAADRLAAAVTSLATDQIGQADHPPVSGRLLVANDHVAALVSEATTRSSPFIAVASHGDRASARPTMSRTTTGLAAEATCPVLVIQD